MRGFLRWITFPTSTLLFILFLWETYSLLPVPLAPSVQTPRNYVLGSVHVPSAAGSARGPKRFAEIALAAQKNHLDFVVVADKNSSAARKAGLERRYGDVDLFVEMEVATRAGDLVAFYSHTDAVSEPDAQVVQLAYDHALGKRTRPGLFAIVAHPSHVQRPWTNLDRIPDGVELIDLDSLWRRQAVDNPLSFSLSVALLAWNPYLAILRFLRPYNKDFIAWDGMDAVSAAHVGILGSESIEQLGVPPMSIAWPTPLTLFRVGANAVLLREPLATNFEDRKKQIYSAIRAGRVAMVFTLFHPFEGNSFSLTCARARYELADQVPSNATGCSFVVRVPPDLPYPATIALLRNGERIGERTAGPGGEVVWPLRSQAAVADASGAYRAEVCLRPTSALHLFQRLHVPYILYNPIFVR